MNIEDKLDEDFLFYLGFTGTALQKLSECAKPKAQQWLQKLCGEAWTSVAQKRNRNIFLSNLLLDLEEKQLTPPFTQNPDEVDFQNAAEYFPAIATEVHTPPWVTQDVDIPPPQDDGETRVDGRTYVATRTMPGGEGAFAYVAVNMSDEPMWLGGGEGAFDKAMEQKFKEYNPPQSEMEAVLARRKDPKERQRVITFYEVIMQNIADELDGKLRKEDNEQVEGLLKQLVDDLKSKGLMENLDCLCDDEKRAELLLMLYSLTEKRKRETQAREDVLDQIGEELNASFFEQSPIAEADKFEMPSAMWEYCMNRPPAPKNLTLLRETYPAFMVETFLELLASQKEQIASRVHQRHVNVITQMKHELKTEGDKYKKWVEEIAQQADQMEVVLKAVQKGYERQAQSKEAANKRKKGGVTELTGLYEKMREALLATQKGVEAESEHGHYLAEQINVVNAQTEMYNEITEKTIMMTEQANMELMKNIKRLQAAVGMHEGRINQLAARPDTTGDECGKQMFIV